MLNKVYTLYTIICLTFLATNIFGTSCTEGDKAYRILHYQKAIDAYLICQKQNNLTDLKSLTKLAHSYRMLDKYAEAAEVYKFTLKQKNVPQDNFYLYISCLQAQEYFPSEINKILDSLIRARPRDKKLAELKKVSEISTSQDSFILSKVVFNSLEADFAPQFIDGKLVFGSTRPSDAKMDGFTSQNFARLWTFDSITKVVAQYVIDGMDVKFNIGTPVFDPLDGSLFFSANVPKPNRLGSANLTIYRAKLMDKKYKVENWQNAAGNFNYTHPTISPNGQLMVFSSDQGGKAMDLYFCTRMKSGDWSNPRPFKRNINTMGQEVFPRFISNSQLIFSSDGLKLGESLDFYQTSFRNKEWTDPVLLPKPLNTQKDDYAIWSDSLLTEGFFTSNRDDKDGNEDIYSFRKVKKCVIKTQIFNDYEHLAVTNQPIQYDANFRTNTIGDAKSAAAYYSYYPRQDLNVSTIYQGIDFDSLVVANPDCQGDTISIVWHYKPNIVTISGKLKPQNGIIPPPMPIKIIPNGSLDTLEVITNEKGEFSIPLIEGKTYSFISKPIGYVANPVTVKISTNTPSIEIHLIPLDVNSSFVLKDIYYDFDKWNITPKSAIELDKLVQILKDYPTLKIELSSHTDARGKDPYNMTLSAKRARSAVDFIISRGIAKSRLVAKGYGETRHVNKCVNGVECTENEHQDNRRTEVRILSK
jgi:outer membrane protein OmpA-like peptidoglycan-associated protein/tetratricopeptide (TPR) repeat protein